MEFDPIEKLTPKNLIQILNTMCLILYYVSPIEVHELAVYEIHENGPKKPDTTVLRQSQTHNSAKEINLCFAVVL